MYRWGFFVGVVLISPLVAPMMTLAVGLYATEQVLRERRLERKATQALKQYQAAVDRLRSRVRPRPTCWERLLDPAF